MTVSTTAITKPVAGAMETATAEKDKTGATAAGADSSSHQANTYHHHYSSMTNGNTGTNDIHDYHHTRLIITTTTTHPVAIIDTGYYADIVQQPVRVRCSEYYNNGTVSHPIEPCIANKTISHYSSNYISQQQQASSSSSSLVEQHIPHNQHSVPLSHNYPSSPFRRLQSTQAIRDHPSTPLVDASHPLQQSLTSTSNRGSTHISPPFPSSGIDTLASLDFKTSHHPHPLSHEAPNSTDPADADHYPDNKRSVWTDITHRVLQLPLPSAPTASLFGSQTTARGHCHGGRWEPWCILFLLRYWH
ncbi:hypothetical protein BASA50_009203 [Batrachochytrium salamandrivorans]|uniref:Uncharacterized protein n=1 Tax=Batrachochytrium salamandrivorans TaxID=1357716 RepID=A0ABQ8F591_9FUNG|nr:hypothetical protein BASA50_009203 [Batrachochytrium salamandrivorans]